MNIVFGGSFNPPTLAHFEMLKYLESMQDVKRIILLPVGSDYQKNELISQKHRYNMLKILTKKLKKTIISKKEFNHSFKGTYQSLKALRYKNIYYVIGADNLFQLKNWINFEKLIKEYKFIVFNRNEQELEKIIIENYRDYQEHFMLINKTYNYSSSYVRKNIRESDDKLDYDVYQYILKNNLYIRSENNG